MVDSESRDIESIRRRWNKRAERYDEWYRTFEGAVEQYVDWELLREHVPDNRDAKILDAAGGTGRITLPLAKMGYPVTLCDISLGMLDVARQKLPKEAASPRVKMLECDVCSLPFRDESFDFVLCWDGMIEAARELVRVAKRGGRISVFLTNRCRGAIDLFPEDPASALTILKSRSNHISDNEEKHRAVSAEEGRKLFETEGVRVIDMYAVCGWLKVLGIPQEVLESCNWDEEFFRQTAEMVLRLAREPSVRGMSRHLVLYGEKL